MARITLHAVLRLLNPLFAVLVVFSSFNVTAHAEAPLSLSPAHVLESSTLPTPVSKTLLSTCGAHICCINVPAEQSALAGVMPYNTLAYACYQQVAVVSSHSPDTPPPR